MVSDLHRSFKFLICCLDLPYSVLILLFLNLLNFLFNFKLSILYKEHSIGIISILLIDYLVSIKDLLMQEIDHPLHFILRKIAEYSEPFEKPDFLIGLPLHCIAIDDIKI